MQAWGSGGGVPLRVARDDQNAIVRAELLVGIATAAWFGQAHDGEVPLVFRFEEEGRAPGAILVLQPGAERHDGRRDRYLSVPLGENKQVDQVGRLQLAAFQLRLHFGAVEVAAHMKEPKRHGANHVAAQRLSGCGVILERKPAGYFPRLAGIEARPDADRIINLDRIQFHEITSIFDQKSPYPHAEDAAS
jgi:hypothetical protein